MRAVDARYEAQQVDLLNRLRRLMRLRQQYAQDMNDEGFVLMQRAINATCGDCMDFGCFSRAAGILRGEEP